MSTFIYFGTPYVAKDTLQVLVEKGFTPKLVVTSPDAPSGRGLVLTPSDTKTWALEHNLLVRTPEKLDASAITELRALGADYAVVVAYGKILPQALIDIFPKGVLNVHYSLLPRYRGASPVESALLNGDIVTGVSVQRMVYKLDAGDVVAAREIAILPTDTTRELRARLIQEGAELLAETLPHYLAGDMTPVPQDETQATHCGKIDKKDGELDLAADGEKNWNTYRAYAESPGTYFFARRGDKRIRVKIVTASFESNTFTPVRIIPEGKKEMNYTDFVRSL
ncbi:MAG: methionyl-tRNA formyltransferase [Patescibacteria group bacterium]